MNPVRRQSRMLPTFPTFIFRISGHEETEEDKLASLIVPYFTWEQRKPNRSHFSLKKDSPVRDRKYGDRWKIKFSSSYLLCALGLVLVVLTLIRFNGVSDKKIE